MRTLALALTIVSSTPAPADEPDWADLARLLACGAGVHVACPAPPIWTLHDQGLLDAESAHALLCINPIGAGFADQVPVAVGRSGPASPWIAFGHRLWHPRSAALGPPLHTIDERLPGVLQKLQGALHATSDRTEDHGPARLVVALYPPEEDAKPWTLVQERLLTVRLGATHGYGPELPLVGPAGLPSPAELEAARARGAYTVRVIEAHSHAIECTPLAGGRPAWTATWNALLTEEGQIRIRERRPPPYW